MERSRHLGGAAALLAVLASSLAFLGAAPASARLAESLDNASVHFVLDKALVGALQEQGVRVGASGPAALRGRTLTMPLREAFLEYGRGSGYAIPRGGLVFRGPDGSVALSSIVLNTAKGRFNAKIDGRETVLANPEGINGTPTRYGLEVAVKRLLLTGAGARALNRALGLRRVFVAGSPLAGARVSGEAPTVPIAATSLEFSFDEGFRQKLATLGVTVAVTGAATQVGAAPLAFAFPDAGGDGNRALSHGGVGSRSSLHLTQGAFPDQHEATLGISMSFESSLAAFIRETWPSSHSGAPLGEGDFAATATIDQATGALTVAPTKVTLSSYGAPELNDAFGAGLPQQFLVGESIGILTFAGRLGR